MIKITDPLPVLDYGSLQLVGITVDFEDLVEVENQHDPDARFYPALVTVPDNLTLDGQIARAARASYTTGTKKVSSDAKLIDRLMKDRHTSPFEQVEFKFVVHAPLFVVQQMLRHRTANVNQESARYSVIKDATYVPAQLRKQHASNKQMSGEPFDEIENNQLRNHILDAYEQAFEIYETLLEAGVSREQARIVLPHGTYTTLVWKMDLHNLLHFLRLRLAPDAQPEIQAYAKTMLELIEPWVPDTIKSWRRHVLGETSE